MYKNKSKILKGLIITGLAITIVGCSTKGDKTPIGDNTPVKVEKPGVEVTELAWSVQPKIGIIKGDYYRIEERFRQGHLGILEIVKN